MTQLALYDTAREALAEALRVDEVMAVKNTAEQIKLYGRQAKDRRIIADGQALQLRAERKLGQLLISAHQIGQLGIGRPGKSNLGKNGAAAEPFSDEEDGESVERITLAAAGIPKKLSSSAQRWARLGDGEFEDKLTEIRDKIESGSAVVVNPLKDLTTAEKKAARATREAELGARQVALPVAKFGVIYADPEWQFETRSAQGMDRSADNHYPTSPLEAIKARDVGSLAADDAVLFLWATAPMLPQALEVMAAWGFAYKTNFNWHKDRIGTGFLNRNRHEHLLLGTRGNVPAPAMGDQFDSSIEAAVGAHSAKPEIFYELIESYFPSLPKIELNARQARKGWVRWGYEAPAENTHEWSGTAREAPGSSAPGNGIADLSEGLRISSEGEPAARSASLTAEQHGTQSATRLHSNAPGEPAIGEGAPHRSLPVPDLNAIIRDGYARNASLSELAAATGLKINAIKQRAWRMEITSTDRQKAAVAAANRRRAGAA